MNILTIYLPVIDNSISMEATATSFSPLKQHNGSSMCHIP